MARLAHAKLIHEVHDMGPATLIEVGGMSRKHPFVQLMQWGEIASVEIQMQWCLCYQMQRNILWHMA